VKQVIKYFTSAIIKFCWWKEL